MEANSAQKAFLVQLDVHSRLLPSSLIRVEPSLRSSLVPGIKMNALCLLLLAAAATWLQVCSSPSGLSLQAEWELLGVNEASTAEEVKKAHRKLSLELHPDKNPGCSDCATRLAEINAAYDTIIYNRKHLDSPDLAIFFGFSEKLFAIIKDVADLWNHIPQEQKERTQRLFEEYKSSESFDKDLAHAGSLLSRWINQILESNANEIFVVLMIIVAWNVLAILGCIWTVILSLRLFNFILLRPVWWVGKWLGLWGRPSKAAGAGGGGAASPSRGGNVALTGTAGQEQAGTPARRKND